MVFSLIVLLLLVVFLAFFIGENLSNVCTFWFFKTFTDLPVAILALIAFGCGVVVSILIFLVATLKKSAAQDKIEEAKDSAKKKQDKVQKEIKRLEKKNKKTVKNKKTKDSVEISVSDESSNNPIIQEDKSK